MRRRPTWFFKDGQPMRVRRGACPAARASACRATSGDGARAPALRQAAVGGAVPAGDPARPRRLRDHAAAARRARPAIAATGALSARGARDLLRRRRQAACRSGRSCATRRSRRSSSSSRRGARTASTSARTRRRSSPTVSGAPHNPSPMTRRRPRLLRREGAAAGLRHLPRLPDLRHGPAVVGRDRRCSRS